MSNIQQMFKINCMQCWVYTQWISKKVEVNARISP